MTPPLFSLVTLKCPKCDISQLYYDKPDIVCDYCVFDMKVKGEMQEYTGAKPRKW